MAKGKERYKRFRKGVVDWLQSSADLVTLTGHTSSDLRIYGMSGEDALKNRMCGVSINSVLPLHETVDKGHYDSMLELVLRHTNEGSLYDMAGTVEDLAAQDANDQEDATFDGTNLRAVHIRYLGIGAYGAATEPTVGVFELHVMLRIIWIETT